MKVHILEGPCCSKNHKYRNMCVKLFGIYFAVAAHNMPGGFGPCSCGLHWSPAHPHQVKSSKFSQFSLPPSPGTAEQAEALQVLQQEVGLDFWLEPIQGRAVDIRVAPEQVDSIFQLNK